MTQVSGVVLSAARVAVSFLFVCHGFSILFGLLGGVGGHGGAAPLWSWPAWWAGVIHLVGGGLVLLGLFTRPAAVVCAGSMAYAYFVVHQPTGLFPIQNGGEPAALYCWFFLVIAVVGPGPFAVDALLRRRRPQRAAQPV